MFSYIYYDIYNYENKICMLLLFWWLRLKGYIKTTKKRLE